MARDVVFDHHERVAFLLPLVLEDWLMYNFSDCPIASCALQGRFDRVRGRRRKGIVLFPHFRSCEVHFATHVHLVFVLGYGLFGFF